MEKEKQLKIDALMQSIDKRIEVNQSVVRMALNDAANAHENIRFAKYVRAQVRDILGLTGVTGAAATTEATACSFRIENQTGRNGKTGDLVMSNGKHNFVLVLISDRKAWQQKGYTPEGIYVIAPNGETGMISLHNMSLSNPEKGSLSKSGADVCMPFGGYGVHVDGLVEYGKDDDRKNPVINRAGEEIDDSFYGYLPSGYNRGTVMGSLALHPDFASLCINRDETWQPAELGLLLKMHRYWFEDRKLGMDLVTTLLNYKADISQKVEKSIEANGNRADVFLQVVNSNLPKTITLNLPIFKGTPAIPVEIEFFAKVNGNDVSFHLISPGANDALQEYRDRAIDVELAKIREIAPEIAIIEQ